MRNWLIKLLGGYTADEYKEQESHFAATKQNLIDDINRYIAANRYLHTEMSEVKDELKIARAEHEQTEKELQAVKAELTKARESEEKAQGELSATKAELADAKGELTKAQNELAEAKKETIKAKENFNFVIAMDGVKVWIK